MSYIPSDNARTYIDVNTKKHMITYTALPINGIPGVYLTTLMQLGDWCRRSMGRPEYVIAQKELDTYERKLRSEFGQLVTREEMRPREWDGRHDN